MFAYLVAFLSPMTYAVSNLIDSHVSNNVFKRVQSVVFYNVVTNVLVVPFLFFFGVPHLPSLAVLPYLLAACIIEILYQIPYYAAMRKVDTSVVSALFSLGRVVVPVAAFFLLGEKLSQLQYVGFFVIIVFTVALSLEKNLRSIKLNRAFGLMLLSSVLLSLQMVLYKKALEDIDWVSNVFWTMTISSSLCLLLLFSKANRQDIFAQKKEFVGRLSMFLINEFFNQVAFLTYQYALVLLPVVVFSAITSTQPLFAMIYGYFVVFIFQHKVQENLDKESLIKKAICFIFIIVGVVLTVWS